MKKIALTLVCLFMFLLAGAAYAESVWLSHTEVKVDTTRLAELNHQANAIWPMDPRYYGLPRWQYQERYLREEIKKRLNDSQFISQLPEFRRQVSEFLVAGGVVFAKYESWSKMSGVDDHVAELAPSLGDVHPLLILTVRSVLFEARHALANKFASFGQSFWNQVPFADQMAKPSQEQKNNLEKIEACLFPTVRDDQDPSHISPSDFCQSPEVAEIEPVYRRFTIGALLFRVLFSLDLQKSQYTLYNISLGDGTQPQQENRDKEFDMTNHLFQIGDSLLVATFFMRPLF